ncbi:TonB-dependent receptor [Novosphingobium sp. KN65.2]|uniref:TonB-dependent receptor n=1 Tax=Novosphingobium sp. KN65.2 TaxID=1478134 RepID=UPI0006D54F1E|nr:TonB-dependent receptor [Novosphingobium sp. KN65.2]
MARLLLSASALALAATGQMASAQTNQSATSSAQSSDSAVGISEIVVTAQRREESAQRAGIPIDVVSGDELTRQGVNEAEDLSKLVPALNVQSAGGANLTFFLRGVGNFTVNGYSDPALAFNYDGVYLARPTSASGVFYDLARVEVLKGPQGTLYGRNATAGAINVIPQAPKLGDLSGYMTASYGNYDALTLEAALNAPLSENAAVRVSGNLAQHDGYLSDGTSDQRGRAARVQLLVEPSADLRIRVAADYSHDGGKGTGSSYAGRYAFNYQAGQYAFVPSGLDRSVGLFDPEAQAYRQSLFLGVSGRTAAPLDQNVYLDNAFYGINAEISYDTGIGTLTVIPAWRRSKLDTRFGNPAFIGWNQETDNQHSIEARLTGDRVGMFDYVVGAYYFDERVKGNYTFAQQALNAYQDFDSKTRSLAAFGRVTAHLTDKFRFIGGLRYTDDHKRFDGQADVFVIVCTARNAFGAPDCPTVPLLPVTDSFTELQPPYLIPPANQARPIGATGAILTHPVTSVNSVLNSGQLTWRAGIEYDVGPQSLFYASAERGYRSGGFSLSAGYETYRPEYLTAYTIGLKNRLLNNRLQLNIEGFWWDYKDQQIGRVGVDARGNQGQFSQNIGQSRIRGAEVDVAFLPVRNTLLSADIQYLDTRYKSFVYREPVGPSGQPPLTGCATSLASGEYTIDCSGFPAFNAPKWTINLAAQQTIEFGDYRVVAGVDTQYRSSRYVQADFLPQERAPGNWMTNAQLSLSPQTEAWEIVAFVRNIENDRILLNTPVYSAASSLQEITSAPRTYGLRAGIKF